MASAAQFYAMLLCLLEARQAALCSRPVRSFVCLFVRSSVWHEKINFGGQDVNSQGCRRRPKIDLEPGVGIVLDPSGWSSFFLV